MTGWIIAVMLLMFALIGFVMAGTTKKHGNKTVTYATDAAWVPPQDRQAVAPAPSARISDDTPKPDNLHTTGKVWAELIRSSVTGLVIIIAAELLIALCQWWDYWRWGVGLGLFVAVGYYLVLQKQWYDLTRVIWKVEQETGTDINHDGQIGKPQPIRVELWSSPLQMTASTIAAVDRETLADIARVVSQGCPFSEREICERARISGPKFRALQDELIAGGMLEMKSAGHPQQGYRLTDAGMAVLQAVLPSPNGVNRA